MNYAFKMMAVVLALGVLMLQGCQTGNYHENFLKNSKENRDIYNSTLNAHMSGHSNYKICSYALDLTDTENVFVQEAKRRGLDCGVKSKEIIKVVKPSSLPNCPKSGFKKNCYGSVLYAHGGKYNGEWKNNFEHGFGEYAYSNGDKYVGNSKYGKKEGKGTFIFNNGSIYEGDYKDGKLIRKIKL
mgnify:CR=1 FL=1